MAKSAQATVKKAPSKPASRSSSNNGKKDNFALYAAIIAVTLLVVLLVFYFFTHTSSTYESKQTYLPLPQMTYESNGQVVQLQVNIQVGDKDKEWLEKNHSEIDEIFKKSVQEIDPDLFRSKKGNEDVLKKLKDDINSKMNVNKVEAVLYKDMLIQHQVE